MAQQSGSGSHDKTQDNWRYCVRCSCLRYGGNEGKCPAGGDHVDINASYNCCLAYTVLG